MTLIRYMECDRRGDGFGSKAMHQVQCEVHQIHHTAYQLQSRTPRCWPCHAGKWDPVPASPVSLHLPGGTWPLLVVLSSTLQDVKKASKMAHQGLVRIFVFIHTCPSPFHTLVMPPWLKPVLAQGAWRVTNVAEKDMRGLVKGRGARLSSKESLLSSPPPAMASKLPSAPLSSPEPHCMGRWVRMCQPWLPPHLMCKGGWKTCQQNVSFFLREEIENLYWRETKPRGRKLMAEKLCLQT